MTTSFRLPERLDSSSVEIDDLVHRISTGSVILDWVDVREVEHDALRSLLEPFLSSMDQFEDALGIMTMPDEVEADVNFVLGAGPDPSTLGNQDPAPSSDPHDPVLSMDLTSAEGVRAAFTDIVCTDLLGPAGGPEEELLFDPPRNRYVVGTLAPRFTTDQPGAQMVLDDSLQGAGGSSADEGNADSNIAASDTLYSSSVGMTFVVAGGINRIKVSATWGRYIRTRSETHFNDSGTAKMVWKRIPSGRELELELEEASLESPPIPLDNETPEIYLRPIIRKAAPDGTRVISLFLVNDQVGDRVRPDRFWVFQPEIRVEAVDGQSAIFARRDQLSDFSAGDGPEAEERAILEMVHRKQAEFAIGHGISVHATPAGDPWVDDAGWESATQIRTAVLPSTDVPVTETPTDEELADRFPGFEGFVLDMAELASLGQEELADALRRIPATYSLWIEEQRSRLKGDRALAHHQSAGTLALDNAARAQKRLAAGVDLIANDENAYRAFVFANEAMRLQRLRSVYALQRRRGEWDLDFETVEANTPAAWRAFQLAFLLLNVETVTDLESEDRNRSVGAWADLLWFPTGGGKTEAYLGVAAYSVALRRLAGEVAGYQGDGGVSVIMRYTLRLLTLQQFQRSATLVCAMEQLRLQDPASWGNEPFRIGLWVGGSSTPNTTAEAIKWLNANRGEHNFHAGEGAASPLQLTNCPWCGETMSADNLKIESLKGGRGQTFLFCRTKNCDFTARKNPEGIPVMTVDEEIYRRLPTFLLATVDKFAQMPWRGEVQALFGRVSSGCERHGWLGTEPPDGCTGTHTKRGSLSAASKIPAPTNGFRPPDLIIQDELHLISGPLGTMVGLYETAVDQLCEWSLGDIAVRPKVIASTATTRRALEQIQNLFSRRVAIFPPPGLDADDNFFSVQRSPEAKPGRRYVGICAPGRSRPSVLIRVYVAVFTASQWLYENLDDEHAHLADPYMTLIGYFNSLRELGGMRRLIDDDVITRAFRIERDDRPGLTQRKMFSSRTKELTSRIRSSQIPVVLDELEVSFDRSRPEKDANGKKLPKALDAVIATNMVSVGVDVDRLGVMVVSGQPKATAEYIQATSRVGRKHPGVVFTVLNWARPRDLSHYEQFEQYHSVFYRFVEALSVTPFAPRALNRGLTGVLASKIRLGGSDYNPNSAASLVKGPHGFEDLMQAIADRATDVTFPDDDHTAIGMRVRKAMTERLDAWAHEAARVAGEGQLRYREVSRDRDGRTVELLKNPGTGPWELFTTPTSMREVEPGVGLIMRPAERDQVPSWDFTPPQGDDNE